MVASIQRDDQSLPVLDEQLCFALYTASHRIIRAYRPLLKPLGLTYVQYLVMLLLWERDPRSVGELGQQLHLDSGTLTPLLKRMENSDLVVRERDSDDERRVLISLTAHGRDLRSKANAVFDSMLCQVELSRPDALELRERILTLADRLG